MLAAIAMPSPGEPLVAIPLDGRVMLFATGAAAASAVLCTLAPALFTARTNLSAVLGSEGRSVIQAGMRGRKLLVSAQIALSLTILVGAGLFVRALDRATEIDPGFDPHGVELAALDLSLAGYTADTGRVFTRELIQRVRDLPGVQSATLAAMVPLGGGGLGLGGLAVPGVQLPNGRRFFDADWNVVTPGYFAAMKMALASGRDFTDADREAAPWVVIVNETAARRWWPNQDAIGKTLLQQSFTPGALDATRTLTVIAVARDTKYRDLGEEPRPFVYVPSQQQWLPRTTIVARSTQGQRLAADIRKLLASLNPNLPIVQSQTFEDYAALTLIPQRVAASVSGSLGIVGLLLAAIGIYGVTAYMVSSRTREIGIRVALGAQRRDVVRMVLRQGMTLALMGVAIGLTLAAGVSRLLGSLLFGIGPTDPLAFGGSAVLFCLIGLIACYVPARRATAVDAMEALRYE